MSGEELLKEVFYLLAERYPWGLYGFIETSLPELNKELRTAEDKIDRCILDRKSTDELKAALREYWIIHMKAIEEFEKAETSETEDYKERRVDG